MDLPAVLAGRAPESPRRVLWLIEWLGEGSAFYASCRGGPQHRPWPLPMVLAAAMVNALNGANWQRSGGKGARPKPVTTPQIRRRGGRRLAGDRIRRGLAGR